MRKFSEILKFAKVDQEIVFSDFKFVGFSKITNTVDGKISAKAEFKVHKDILESGISDILDKVKKNVYDIEKTSNGIINNWIKKFKKKFTVIVSKNFIQFVHTNYDTTIKELSLKLDNKYDSSFDESYAYFSINFIAKGEKSEG